MTEEQVDNAIATFAESIDDEKLECWRVCWMLQNAACQAVIDGRYSESKWLFEKAAVALAAHFKRWG